MTSAQMCHWAEVQQKPLEFFQALEEPAKGMDIGYVFAAQCICHRVGKGYRMQQT